MKILTDVHTHTLASQHAYCTLLENINYAKRIGLKLIAITDHTPGITDGCHPWHFRNMRTWPRVMEGITVIRGAEANVMGLDGSIDLDEDAAKLLDWVIVSYHSPTMDDVGTKEQRTEAYINILKNPQVDMLGHSGTPSFDYDIDAVLKTAKEYNKVIEINEHTFIVRQKSVGNCRTIAEKCAEYGVKIAVNSDAHICYEMGNYENVLKMLEEINFPEELIINTTPERFIEHLNSRANGKKIILEDK